MLGKLAYRNTKRNIKDYMIYLITVTVSFSLIFAFNLVASSDEIVKLCSSMDAFKNSLFAVNILIVFVICFLINYTTKFMFEKRSKELGTYMLLGIEKKEIAHLVVIENILLGILAIVLAIPIGFLFSQFVSLVIVNLLGIPKTLFISLNFVSIGLLIIYFLTIYVLVLLNLLRRISKMTIRDFLYFDKQNEKKMFRDSKKRNVIFVLSIILGVISLFLWNSRCTMDNFNKQETLTYLMVSVIMLIISIYGISTTCADMFLTVLLKNKKMKYQNDNLFVARTFASKARTMSFTFGTLSMLILTSLLALNYSSINKASYDISVNLNAPYDVQLFDDKQVFDEYIRVIEEEYTIDNTIEYDIYKEPNHQVQNFFQSEYYDFDPVLKLSDYNRLLELRKMPLLSLNDNEYYIVTNSKFAYEVGYEVCRKIKQVMPVPIIFVTSRDTNADELKSIQVGGIDFITKPYDTLILLEKIKRALQLSNPNNFRELVKKDCTLDLHLSILKYQEQSIELTRNEFRILYYFFMNEDKVISKEELLEKLWNDKYYIDENVLLVNMTRLKKKMKEIGIVHLLENIRGKGWKL